MRKNNKRMMFRPLSRSVQTRLALLAISVSIPITAWSLGLPDYLNQSTVTASSSQFETNTANNTDTVQIIPNAELIVVKQVINDDGGDAGLGDFALATDAGTLNFDAGVVTGNTTTFTSDTIYVPPGTYSLTELDFDGYTEGAWACTVGTVGSSTFDSGSVTLAFGEQTVCTISNDDIAPMLTLAKTVVNDDGGVLADTDFSLSVDSTVVLNGDPTTVVANTPILISELDVDGYDEGSWDCKDDAGLTTTLPSAGLATGESIVLEPGSDVTCSIINDDIAPILTLTKEVVNDNGGDLAILDFDISIDGTEVTSGSPNFVKANTAINISELDVAGYTEGTWACEDDNGLTAGLPLTGDATGELITLASGSDVTCLISNNDIAPILTLTKTLNNDNGGSNVITDFEISIDGSVVGNNAPNVVLANKVITISELDLDGYTEGTWSCSDDNGQTIGLPTAGDATGTSLTLAPGSDVNCAITNDDVAPRLTLVKYLTNDDGGDKIIEDFDIAIDGVEVGSGDINIVAANTDIVISELLLDGYTEGTWSCNDTTGLTTALPATGAAAGETINLAEGAIVTCEISNNDIAPLLTLTKKVTNDDGGLLAIPDFDISIDSIEVNSGTQNPVKANTAINISELDVDGYTEGTWFCSDDNGLTTGLPTAGLATATSVELLPGSDVNCEITNDDIAPILTLTKTLYNDNGGDLSINDFNVSIDGAQVVDGGPNTVKSNVAILISELALPGYTEGEWSCSDSTGLTAVLPSNGLATGESITLAPGSIVDCEISNDDIAPTLTLTKKVINDDGGDKVISDFNISIDGTVVPSGSVNTVTANVGVLISELNIPGYTAGTWSCTDTAVLTTGLPTAGAATGESITLKQGSIVTCHIENDDVAPKLTLNKTVINDNGGDKEIEDFEISIDGLVVDSGDPITVKANTVITISELDLVPYSEGTWSCSDVNGLTTGLPATGAATGTDISLLPGSDVTCSIINNDLGIDLSIAKTVDDSTPNIGQTITFELVVSNAGPDIGTNVTVTDPVPAGFTYVASSISGGDASSDADPTGTGLSWTINSIPVGSPATLTFQAVVNAP